MAHSSGRVRRPAPGDLDLASEVVRADADSAARTLAETRGLAGGPGASHGSLAELAAVLATALPVPVVRAVHRYGNSGSPHDTLLVRGLLPGAGGLQPTPVTVTPPALDCDGQAAELLLLAVLSLLGEPFTFASLYEGRLVQHVTAVPGRERAQTSEGSQVALEWHVEDAFIDERCDYLGLLCLRGAADAVTTVAAARTLRLPENIERVLRQPRFVTGPDIAHGDGQGGSLPAASVLSGPPGDPEICFDAVYQRPADPADSQGAAALRVLADAIGAAAVGHVLEAGDLLVVDNRRVVHGRTGYRPHYDGTGRWLLRTMVCASKRAHRRRGGVRVLASARQT